MPCPRAGGVALITHPPLLFGSSGTAWTTGMSFGVACGLGSAAFAAVAFLSIKSLGSNERPIVMSMWFHTTAALTTIVPLCMRFPVPAVLPSWWETGLLLNIACMSFLGQLLISRGFQLLSPSSAAAINLTQVVHARVLSAAVLHDPVHWYSFAGSALIAAGVLLSRAGTGGSGATRDHENCEQELASARDNCDEAGALLGVPVADEQPANGCAEAHASDADLMRRSLEADTLAVDVG